MKSRVIKAAVAVALVASSVNAQTPEQARQYAIFKTSVGDFTCELYRDKAPKTVDNFVGLATGTKDWKLDGTDKKNTPLYNGTVFHRTIPDFMIQGGDPRGNGTGGPGYTFEDEFSDLKFSDKGLLAMANRGSNTNGSQFFVTVAPTPHLNGRHTIFGKVVSGYDVVEKISKRPSGPNGAVTNPVVLEKVIISNTKDANPTAANKVADTKTTGTK
ncbi:MAG: peptidylprolyl isomerase [Candidatus Sumerlaeales bacterium]|nr:peptidylprolyl isomerase [Candidatus Sumerlaeales bacterium]